MSKARITTIALAIILGAGGAWFGLPRLSRYRALNAITHDDASERRAGWTWLLARGGDGRLRVVAELDRVNHALADAGDAALSDGAAVLRARNLWGWDRQEHALVLRELRLRAAAGKEAAAAGALLEAPLDVDPRSLLKLINALLQSDFVAARQTAFLAACGWAGPERGDWIAALAPRGDDTDLRRARHLVTSWCDPAPPLGPVDPAMPPEVVDAVLLRQVRLDPDDVGVLLAMCTHPTVAPPVVMPDVLRYARDPRALDMLRRLARDGNRGAEFALQTRSADRDETQAKLVLADADQPVTIRRLAAWRWGGVPLDRVRALLALDAADEDGAVYATALLAERHLPRAEAEQQAEQWIRSFNDDEKRAGALLAALLGVHADLLQEALDLENVPRVRTVQRLALAALGVIRGAEDIDEFGFRALHLPGGGLDPDILLCLLAAGRTEALRFLTRRPPGDAAKLGRAVQKQAWLIERFVPMWHDVVGRPIGSSVRGLFLYFDDLEASRMLYSRRWTFDAGRRVFEPESTS